MTRRTTVTVLVSLVLLSASVPAGAGVAAADGFVSVSVDVPAFPTPEQPFRMSVDVTNGESSDGTHHVVAVELREGESSSSERLAGRGVGTVGVQPGETVSRSFEATLNETGERELYTHVVLVGPDDERRRLVHPTTLDVNGEHPQLSLATEPALPGEPRTMTVNVSNGRDGDIRQLSLDVEGDGVTVDDESRIRARLASGAEEANATAMALRSAFNDRQEVIGVFERAEVSEQIDQAFRQINLFLIGIGAISLLVAGISIANVMLMSVIERKQEIGVLRAVGYHRGDVLRIMLAEAALLGLAGAVVGTAVSFAVGALINGAMLGDPLAFSGEALRYAGVGFGFGVAASVIGGLYPAWKAANAEPVEALRG